MNCISKSLNDQPQLKKEIDLIQNELLLLFLKYNLAFHCQVPSFPGLSIHFRKKRNFLIYCLVHAVMANTTRQHPILRMEFRENRHNDYWLEVSSSGSPDNFFSNMEEYCHDLELQEYVKSLKIKSLGVELAKETVKIMAGDVPGGSKIKLRLI